MLFLPNITEDVIMQHDVLPAHCTIQIEIYLINFMLWLHLDEEILVIEDSVDEQVWALLYIIDFAS